MVSVSREGLLVGDHLAEEDEQQQEQPAAAAAQALQAGSDHVGFELADGDAGLTSPPPEPERSLLSRAGSITGLPRRAPSPRQRSLFAFCAKTSAWFTGTLLLGVLLSIGLVVLLLPPPGQGGIPSCRSGAALTVLSPAATANTSSNASVPQHVFIWSGRGQSGAMYRGLHSFKCALHAWSGCRGARHSCHGQLRPWGAPAAASVGP